VDATLDLLRERGFAHASVIGAFASGAPRISVS
jgi:hypothetical protein